MDPLDETGLADLENACLDLVTERRHEAIIRALLVEHQAGHWVSVSRISEEGASINGGWCHGPDVSVTWLPDPSDDPSYVLIIFFDNCSKWSKAAQYNRTRLLRSGEESSKESVISR